MTRAVERKRAIELKALDVRELIKGSLPAVLPQLASAQIEQLQRVLDAAVINDDVAARYEQLDRLTIKGRNQYNQPVRDPKDPNIARRDQVLKEKIVVRPEEHAVPLNFYKLVTPDALKPTSDNPDEAAYLIVVTEIYERKGIWLVIDEDISGMARNVHANPNDPKHWRVRLMLGYKPGALVEEIKTDTGSLNQRALLSVSRLGAGYWEFVHQGPTLASLRKAIEDVRFQISLGINEHIWWSSHRSDYLITSRVSDTLGRADWPELEIWNLPRNTLGMASTALHAGKLLKASKFALLAAYQAMWCGNAVHQYIDATTRGASRAVKILEVATICGKIAEGILSVIAIGGGLIRLLSRKAATGAVEVGAQRQLTGGQRQLPAGGQTTPTSVSGKSTTGGGSSVHTPTVVTSDGALVAKNVTSGGLHTQMVKAGNNLRQKAGLPPLPGNTHWGALALNEEAQLIRAQREWFAWIKANPKVPLNAQFAEYDRIKARLGVKVQLD